MKNIKQLLLAGLLGLPGCASDATFANRPVADTGQTLQSIYGQPTVFSEGEHLVALGIDQETFRDEQGVLFLRLWVYNGGQSPLSMGHESVSAWMVEHGEAEPAGEEKALISSLSQDEFNHWRDEHTRRKILSVNDRHVGTPVSNPHLNLRGLQECDLLSEAPDGDASLGESRCIREVLDDLDYTLRKPLPTKTSFGTVARAASGRVVLLDENPFNRLVREIRYLRTTPKYRHLLQIEALAPGTVEGGYIALDIDDLPDDGARTVAVTIDAGGEQHLFHIQQSLLSPE
ncbi:hypothetical protein AWR36_001555 [Microbulbifer flavimaris]|uniref:DUF3108 domain-containing protein n=1 Tax=Microbulbifer flavimaris TaxID=1781068 RepID=A0ABX4I4Q7_9GAMM|nr:MULTISPECIES: hypothetical protein [Microbulbifer]KUJ84413.1 hypothetical protein AVO43_01555 [Microbulbifer sp. ZGT114]PCO06499.1 hypothetical protein AWR36_001555 [Microbulbifer flavimaris]